MKAIILCGGKGVRMGEITEAVPKPLVKVGDRPILWHIMKIYASYGHTEFIFLLGYKGEMIREYFSQQENVEPTWHIDFVDTGLEATKSERLAKAKDLVDSEHFFLAYGDDLADINIRRVLKYHEYMDTIVTLTAVKLVSPYGILQLGEENMITQFQEKPLLDSWINGGFMACKRELFDYLHLGELEADVFQHLAEKEKICAYKHKGAWKSMNTLKENRELNKDWDSPQPFWKMWDD